MRTLYRTDISAPLVTKMELGWQHQMHRHKELFYHLLIPDRVTKDQQEN
jgi:hypothetical protein